MKINKLTLVGVIFFIILAAIALCPFVAEAVYYDAGVINLSLSSQPFYVNEQVRISPTIKNYGTKTATYYLDVEVREGNDRLDYSSSKKIYNLSPNSTKKVNFYWYPTRVGEYNICFYTYNSNHTINYEENCYMRWYEVQERESEINWWSFSPSSITVEKGNGATITTTVGITARSDGYLQTYFHGSGIDRMSGKYIAEGSQYVDISVTIPSSQLSNIQAYQPSAYIQFRPHEIIGPLISTRSEDIWVDVPGPIINVTSPQPRISSLSITDWNGNAKSGFNPRDEIRFDTYLTQGANDLTISWSTYDSNNNYMPELSSTYRQTGHPEYNHYWLDNRIPETAAAGNYRVRAQVGSSYKDAYFEVLPWVSIEGYSFSPASQKINLGKAAAVDVTVYLTSNTDGYLQIYLNGQGISQLSGSYLSFIGSHYKSFSITIPASQLTQEQVYNPSLYIQFRPHETAGPLTDSRPGDITRNLSGPLIEVLGRHSVELSVTLGTKCLDFIIFKYCYHDWSSDVTYYGGKAGFSLTVKNTGNKRDKFVLLGDGIPENNPIPPSADIGYVEMELNPGEARTIDTFPVAQNVGGVKVAQWWVTYNDIELARATHEVRTLSWGDYVAYLVTNDPQSPQFRNELSTKILGTVLSLFTNDIETLTKDDMYCLRDGHLMLDECAQAAPGLLLFIDMPASGGAGAAEKAIIKVGDETGEISLQVVRETAAKQGLVDDVMRMVISIKNKIVNIFKREMPDLSLLGDDVSTRFIERYYGTAEQKILTSAEKLIQNRTINPQALARIIENPSFTDRTLFEFFQNLEKAASAKGIEKFINQVSTGGIQAEQALFTSQRIAAFAGSGALREIEKGFSVVFDSGITKSGAIDTMTNEGGKVVANEIKKTTVAGRNLGADGYDLIDDGLIDQLDKYKELIRKGGTSEGLYFKPDKIRLIVEDATDDGLRALQEKYGAVLETTQTGSKTYLLFVLPYQIKTPPQITTNNGQDFATNKISVVIEGTIENYFTGLLINNVSSGISWTDATNWRYTARLTTGDNRFEFVATKGNFRSDLKILNIKYDTIAPTISFSPPAGNYSSAVSVSIICDEPAAIYYTLDGTNPTTSSNRYLIPINIYADSTIVALAIDQAGNQRISAKTTYRIIVNAPDPPVINSVSGGYIGNSVARTIFGSKQKETAIWINNQEAVANNTQTSWSYRVNLVEGANLFDIYARNLAGIESSRVKIELVLDSTPPIITISPAPGTYSQKPLVITMTINEAGDIYYSYDGVLYNKYTQPLSTNVSRTIKYYARDIYSNRSSIFTAKYTLTN